jgi:hypothetical protein
MAPKAAKSKAKAKAKCIGNGKASKGEAKGWSEIQQGNNHMGKLGAQAVMDHLKSLAKCGKPQALATYKGLKGTQEKLQFALQLKVDREAAFLSVKENHAVETSTRDSFVRGWLTEAQVARELGLINYNFFVTPSWNSSEMSWKGCPRSPMTGLTWQPRGTSSMSTVSRG